MNKNKLYLFGLFLASGLLSALSVLVFFSFFSLKDQPLTPSVIIFLTITEELIKIFLLAKVTHYSASYLKLPFLLPAFLLFGLGFAGLELFLIIIGYSSLQFNLNLLQPMVVHLASSLFAGAGIFFIIQGRKLAPLGIVFILLAVLFHLRYNLLLLIG